MPSAGWRVAHAVRTGLSRSEYAACDQVLFRLRGKRPPPASVAIVAIGAQSWAGLPPWPLPNGLHAEVVRHLARLGARVVVLDFPVVPSGDRRHDGALVDACRDTGNVVVACGLEDTGTGAQPGDDSALERGVAASLPFAGLLQVTDPGLTHCPADEDRVIRRAPAFHWRRPTLPVVAAVRFVDRELRTAAIGRELDLGGDIVPLDADTAFWVDFTGPMGQVLRVPFDGVLRRGVRPALVKDRLVFIGVTDPSHCEMVRTPFGPMPMVEVHANIAAMLLENRPLRRAPAWSAWIIAAAARCCGGRSQAQQR